MLAGEVQNKLSQNFQMTHLELDLAAGGYANGLAVLANLPPPEDGVVVLWLSCVCT